MFISLYLLSNEYCCLKIKIRNHMYKELNWWYLIYIFTFMFWLGERVGRGITTDSITTPVVNTSAYWFKNSDELIDFKVDFFLIFPIFVGPWKEICKWICDHRLLNISTVIWQEGRHASYEYGRYGNPTTKVLEEKMKYESHHSVFSFYIFKLCNGAL